MPAYARRAAKSTSNILPASSRPPRRSAELAALKSNCRPGFDKAPWQVQRFEVGRYHLRVFAWATPRLCMDHYISRSDYYEFVRSRRARFERANGRPWEDGVWSKEMFFNVDAAPDESAVELWDFSLDVLTLDSPPHAASPSPASPSLAAANVATPPAMAPLPKTAARTTPWLRTQPPRLHKLPRSLPAIQPPASPFRVPSLKLPHICKTTTTMTKMWEQDLFSNWLEATLSRPPPILPPPASTHPSIRDGTIFWCNSTGRCGEG